MFQQQQEQQQQQQRQRQRQQQQRQRQQQQQQRQRDMSNIGICFSNKNPDIPPFQRPPGYSGGTFVAKVFRGARVKRSWVELGKQLPSHWTGWLYDILKACI